MFTQDLFIIIKYRKQPKCPSIVELGNKLWYMHGIKYNSEVKRNELLVYTTMWMNLKIIMLNEKSQRRIHNIEFYLYKILENIIYSNKKRISGCFRMIVQRKRGEKLYISMNNFFFRSWKCLS